MYSEKRTFSDKEWLILSDCEEHSGHEDLNSGEDFEETRPEDLFRIYAGVERKSQRRAVMVFAAAAICLKKKITKGDLVRV